MLGVEAHMLGVKLSAHPGVGRISGNFRHVSKEYLLPLIFVFIASMKVAYTISKKISLKVLKKHLYKMLLESHKSIKFLLDYLHN